MVARGWSSDVRLLIEKGDPMLPAHRHNVKHFVHMTGNRTGPDRPGEALALPEAISSRNNAGGSRSPRANIYADVPSVRNCLEESDGIVRGQDHRGAIAAENRAATALQSCA